MGGSSSKKKAAPPPVRRQAPRQRYEPTPEELERKRKEEEENKRWIEEAKRVGPPCPPKPIFSPGGSEEEYKRFPLKLMDAESFNFIDLQRYMISKYDYEAWENNIILLSRKLRSAAQG